MLKARMGKTIILGIDKENVRRLKQGKPILIDDPKLYNDKIIIMYGDTVEDMTKELAQYGDLPQ